MLKHLIYDTTFVLIFSLTAVVWAQPPQGGRGGFGPGGPREDLKLVEEYDKNEDGWLNREERVEARKDAQTESHGERGGFGPPGGRRGRVNREPAEPGRKVAPSDVVNYSSESLYDPSVLRTLFFEFENEDWEKELEDFHGTDVEVPVTLTVDGKKYQNVGMRFRGASSYGMVPTGFKRSFNVSINLADDDQRLLGYKTLNLLNSAGDPSFMSTMLYSQIANEHIPAPKANHVHVVINGESWGVYVNVQQFNKDFLAEHYESTKGTRWKVSGSPRADGGLRYLGDEIDPYKERFEMKSNDGKKAWEALILLCKTLNETPLDKLESELEPMLDIDQALKFLALDVALVNSDGYWTRASDYSLFRDGDGRFHIFPHDMNEAMRSGGGRGGRGGRGGPPPERRGEGGPPRDRDQDQQRGRFGRRGGGPGGGGVQLDPLVSIDNDRMPLRSRLLAVPELRAKYLQYMREIAEKSLDWKKIEQVVVRQSKLIEKEVAADTRKLESLEAFQQSMSLELPEDNASARSLRAFFEQRQKFLLEYKAPANDQ